MAGTNRYCYAAEYEFGVKLDQQRHSSHAILRATFAAVAMFWNQLVALSDKDEASLREPELLMMRRAFALELNAMADIVAHKKMYLPTHGADSPDSTIFDHPRYGEYARNIFNRFGELQGEVQNLNAEV